MANMDPGYNSEQDPLLNQIHKTGKKAAKRAISHFNPLDRLRRRMIGEAGGLAKNLLHRALSPIKTLAKKGLSFAKRQAKRAAKKAGKALKALAKNIAKKFLTSKVFRILAITGVFLITFLIIIFMFLEPALQALEFAEGVGKGISYTWSKITSFGQDYDTEALKAWNEGGDIDRTALILQEIENRESDPDAYDNDSFSDLLTNNVAFSDPKTIKKILSRCVDENNRMFETRAVNYEYHDGRGAGEYPNTDTTIDGMYGLLSREHIEGEKMPSGERRFAIHWQDIMAYSVFYAVYNEFGTDADSAYNGNEGAENINSVENYYIGKTQLDTVIDGFAYKTSYLYDGVVDKSHDGLRGYNYQTQLSTGSVNLGYRYLRFLEGEGDVTYYTPESAPDEISNIYDTYKYVYIPISSLPEGYYTPDQGAYNPPDGSFCVGRWHIVDPRDFIETMSSLVDVFKKDTDTSTWGDTYNYVDEMIQAYTDILSYYPYVDEHETSRVDFFLELARMYNEKTVKVSYTGSNYDGYNTYLESIKDSLPAGWTIEEDTSGRIDGLYEKYNGNALHDPSGYPFFSWGVTYSQASVSPIPGKDNGSYDYNARPSNRVYIYSHGEKMVDGWFDIYPGADVRLDVDHYYTKEEIRLMLQYLENKSMLKKPANYIRFTQATDAVFEWNQKTGADISAMLAIIYSEGGYYSRHGVDHYNFFDFTTKDPKYTYEGNHPWWDAKKECGTISAAMVAGMKKIYKNYWTSAKGQNTYYKMCFYDYGYPQSREEAISADVRFTHSYCPWWDDTGYITTGYQSKNAWCNHCAAYRYYFLDAAGVDYSAELVINEPAKEEEGPDLGPMEEYLPTSYYRKQERFMLFA